MNDFDKLSSEYKNILDRDVRLSGEDSVYFAFYKAAYVHKYLGDTFKGSILDYGCGIGAVTGALTKCFKNRSVSILGHDISSKSIDEARGRVEGIDFSENYKDIEGRAFDVIIIANVLHHVPVGERYDFLKKAIVCLAKNGRLFIFEHNPYNPLTKLVVKLSILDRTASLIRAKEMAGLLKSAGIDTVEKKYIIFFPKILRLFRPLEPALGSLPIGAQYVFIGRHKEGV